MNDIDFPPATTTLRPRIVIVVLALFLAAVAITVVAATSIYDGSRTGHSRPISPQDDKQLASQLAAAPVPEPPKDEWVESRDGDGALDVEDINGPGTIYFDKQSRTRLLCIDNNGCYHLRGHHKGSK